MGASPQYKITNPQGEYVAACKYSEDAAALVALYGDGAKILHQGKIVWREGKERVSASESYDFVRDTVLTRIENRSRRRKGLPELAEPPAGFTLGDFQ